MLNFYNKNLIVDDFNTTNIKRFSSLVDRLHINGENLITEYYGFREHNKKDYDMFFLYEIKLLVKKKLL